MPITICSSTIGPDGRRTGQRHAPSLRGDRQLQITKAATPIKSAAASQRLSANGK